ncbi:MAG: ChbG/HpnK family deacetylase [Salinarimonadaceae bacterium]|nr:MAG: ChbG/HpnK family deacetylase [Salinarimonadaceae bacterium]
MARDPTIIASALPPQSGVIVCADGFGETEGASQAILDLVGMERVSALAVQADGAAWPRFAQPLAKLRRDVGIGLQLSLGDGSPSPFDPVALPETVAAIARQVAAFADATGFAPEFIGARRHAHVFPGYRRVLFLALERVDLAGLVWLLDPSASPLAILRRGRARARAFAASALALGFAREARRRGYATNTGFAGFVAGPADFPVERDFQRYLQHRGPAHLVVCRPAYLDDEIERLDRRADRRMRELMYLSSTRYTDLLEVLGLRLLHAPPQSATGIGVPMASSSGPTRQQ